MTGLRGLSGTTRLAVVVRTKRLPPLEDDDDDIVEEVELYEEDRSGHRRTGHECRLQERLLRR